MMTWRDLAFIGIGIGIGALLIFVQPLRENLPDVRRRNDEIAAKIDSER